MEHGLLSSTLDSQHCNCPESAGVRLRADLLYMDMDGHVDVASWGLDTSTGTAVYAPYVSAYSPAESDRRTLASSVRYLDARGRPGASTNRKMSTQVVVRAMSAGEP